MHYLVSIDSQKLFETKKRSFLLLLPANENLFLCARKSIALKSIFMEVNQAQIII